MRHIVPWSDHGELGEHVVGDQGRHAGYISGFELFVQAGRRALETEVVELERVVPGRAVEGDLGPRSIKQRPALLGRVARNGKDRDDEVDVGYRASRLGRAAGDGGEQPVVEVRHRVKGVDVNAVGHLARHLGHPVANR